MKPVEPCGTRAAYMRHRRAGEPPCGPCIRAQSEYIKQYRASKPKKVYREIAEDLNVYEVRMAAALEKDPVVILWRKNNHGVWVHTFIHDPHADSGHNGEKDKCKRGHRYTSANTIRTADGFRQCRTCTNENRKPLTPEQRKRASEVRNQWRQRLRDEKRTEPECTDAALLAAARTEI